MSDPLTALLESLDFTPPDDVIDTGSMNRYQLLTHYRALSDQLVARNELLIATTEEGRRLQSERSAVTVALRAARHLP